jgi:hypothetical protein
VLIRACTDGKIPEDSDFAIHLPFRHGGTFRAGTGQEIPMDDRGIWSGGGGDVGSFSVGPLQFESPTVWLALWPLPPINIYDVPRRLPLEQAVLRLAARLTGQPVEIRMRVP